MSKSENGDKTGNFFTDLLDWWVEIAKKTSDALRSVWFKWTTNKDDVLDFEAPTATPRHRTLRKYMCQSGTADKPCNFCRSTLQTRCHYWFTS